MQVWKKGWFINIGFAVHQGARTPRCQGTPPALKWNKKTSVCINIPIWFTVWLRQRRSRQQPWLPCFLPREKAGHREAVCPGPIRAKSEAASQGCKPLLHFTPRATGSFQSYHRNTLRVQGMVWSLAQVELWQEGFTCQKVCTHLHLIWAKVRVLPLHHAENRAAPQLAPQPTSSPSCLGAAPNSTRCPCESLSLDRHHRQSTMVRFAMFYFIIVQKDTQVYILSFSLQSISWVIQYVVFR